MVNSLQLIALSLFIGRDDAEMFLSQLEDLYLDKRQKNGYGQALIWYFYQVVAGIVPMFQLWRQEHAEGKDASAVRVRPQLVRHIAAVLQRRSVQVPFLAILLCVIVYNSLFLKSPAVRAPIAYSISIDPYIGKSSGDRIDLPVPPVVPPPSVLPIPPVAPASPVLEIIGALPAAQVRVDGKMVGTTDSKGSFRTEVSSAGQHAIELMKDGYTPVLFSAQFTPGELKLIQPDLGQLLKMSGIEPSSPETLRARAEAGAQRAQAEADAAQDRAEAEHEARERAEADAAAARARAPQGHPGTTSIEVVPIGDVSKGFAFPSAMCPDSLSMVENNRTTRCGVLWLRLQKGLGIGDTPLYLNGKMVASDFTAMQFILPQGRYRVRNQTGYAHEVEIQASQTFTITFNRPATPPFAFLPVLEIVGALPAVQVRVDGRIVGTTDSEGSFRTEVSSGGQHAIELMKDGYTPVLFYAQFIPGELIQPDRGQLLKMSRIPGYTPSPPLPPSGDCRTDSYGGLYSGELLWEGDLAPGQVLTITDLASTVGRLSGRLPGCPVSIDLLPNITDVLGNKTVVIRPPSAADNFHELQIRNISLQRIAVLKIRWSIKPFADVAAPAPTDTGGGSVAKER